MKRFVFIMILLLSSGCSSIDSARIRTPLALENSLCKNDTTTVFIHQSNNNSVPENFPKRIEDLIKQTIDLKKQTVECKNSTPRNFVIEGTMLEVVDDTKHAFSSTAGYGSLKIACDFRVKLSDQVVADFHVNKKHFWSMTKKQDESMFLHEFEPFFADVVADVLVPGQN